MKIIICCSIDFVYEIEKIKNKLESVGHSVDIPFTCRRILGGELTLDEFKNEKQKNGDGAFRKIQDDVIKRYYDLIKNSEAVLIANFSKKGIENYIGGNVFLEIGFAHVLNKKIYLLNPIPEISYKDEITAMQPIVLNGDLENFFVK